MMKCTTDAKGFSLVELLVVVAIVALLMGLLIPALAGAKHKAYTVACLSNLGQLGKAMMLYANDYDGGLPTSDPTDEDAMWIALMWDYYVDPGVLLCPADGSPFTCAGVECSYGYNWDVALLANTRGFRISSAVDPSHTLVFADAGGPHIDKNKMEAAEGGLGMQEVVEGWALDFSRHSVNILTLDGRCFTRKYVSPDDPLFNWIDRQR